MLGSDQGWNPRDLSPYAITLTIRLAHLKGIWGHIFSSRKPFSWLEKDNDEQCRWAWEYLRKTDGYSSSKPMTYQFTPTSTAEIYLAIYAAYDTWIIDNGAKRLFKSDFSKAWQQKKLRDGRQGKKACSLVLHEDVKLKLDELAKTRKMTIFIDMDDVLADTYGKHIELYNAEYSQNLTLEKLK